MTRNRDFLLALAIMVSTVPVQAQRETAGSQTNAIVQSIKAGNIGSVEVFGVPPDTLFRSNVTPEHLERIWDYKLIIRGPDALLKARAEELTTVLSSAAIQQSATKLNSLDVRWGSFFGPRRQKVSGLRLYTLMGLADRARSTTYRHRLVLISCLG